MNAILQTFGVQRADFLPEDLAIHFDWAWTDWAWGLCTEFYDLGMVTLVLGPCHIMVDWAIC